MNKKEVAGILEEIGILLELKGENPFKARAYFNAARVIETLDRDLSQIVESGQLSAMKGIGGALAEKISMLVNQGSLPYYDDLKASIPEGLLDLLSIPGLGAKKVKKIYEELQVTSLGELEYACRENRLRDLTGFGQKSQDSILKNIELYKKNSERYLYPLAEDAARQLITYLAKNSDLQKVEVAGSLRRRAETVKDIDIIGACKEEKRSSVMAHFLAYHENMTTISQGTTKSAMTLATGITAELRLVEYGQFPFLLQYNTGSKEHNTHLRRLAKGKNLKLNEYGLFRGDESIACGGEEDIYRHLDLAYIPPEWREDLGEIEQAARGRLPDLYTGKPFYGLFHVHTTYSDGGNTLPEIVTACKQMGLTYVGITDHSKSAFYANGLSEERIKKQWEEIDQLNEKEKDFRIFKGIESDILRDGSLDYTDDILELFDFVIASVHSQFRLTEQEMTDRICRALKNPFLTMLGHPTGRLLLAREAYALNMEKVLETAAEESKIIEINASPYRLDLSWKWGKRATELGLKTSINPDAHSVEGLQDYRYGIGICGKAGFQKQDILNTFTGAEVIAFLESNKSSA